MPFHISLQMMMMMMTIIENDEIKRKKTFFFVDKNYIFYSRWETKKKVAVFSSLVWKKKFLFIFAFCYGLGSMTWITFDVACDASFFNVTDWLASVKKSLRWRYWCCWLGFNDLLEILWNCISIEE
jgi:hypothetical protein